MKQGTKTRSIIIAVGIILSITGATILYFRRPQPTDLPPLSYVSTLMGAGAARLSDPYGIAAAPDGSLYVSDGGTGRIQRINQDGTTKLIAENLDVPSAIALDGGGSLVVAETGAHCISRVEIETGHVSTIAGTRGRSGYADGGASSALFNGPIGLAIGADGTIYVADTYNDRIRSIDTGGQVRTLAGGGSQGTTESVTGAEAFFDTPCGIAVAPDGSLVVADTGNNRLRRLETSGRVTTIAGTGERERMDGPIFAASFNHPTGVAVAADGTIYVAEAGGSAVRECRFLILPEVRTLVGVRGPGLSDGARDGARLRNPANIAIMSDGTLAIADTGNRLVRALAGEHREHGAKLTREEALKMYPSAEMMRKDGSPARWPYDPPERAREIAATFGEIRGEITPVNKEAYFHNGLDIPGAYGETARVVRTERILEPLSVEDVSTTRERIRFPQLGYIHLRIGRDQSDKPFDDERFQVRRDTSGRVVDVRIRRGATFRAGDPLGTLNNQYHVHLIAGPRGGELNALAALELPGVKDTVAPLIEKDGVRLINREWREFKAASDNSSNEARDGGARITVGGDVRIAVRAYDQMDGNASRRRLGLYRLGYQVLKDDGTPADGFTEPLMTISFETLPADGVSAAIAYAEGSRSGATGETIFTYIVTNHVRDHEAAEDFWHASALAPGNYTLRVIAEDFFGNRTVRDVPVNVKSNSG